MNAKIDNEMRKLYGPPESQKKQRFHLDTATSKVVDSKWKYTFPAGPSNVYIPGFGESNG